MSSARSDAELLSSLRELISDNAESLFGLGWEQVRVKRLCLGRAHHRTPSRHHRELTVQYSEKGEPREKRVWLKFLPGARALYTIHATVWNQTHDVCALFPRPYFYGEWSGGEVVGMELIEGASLRDLFLRRAITRRSAALTGVFTDLGKALRAFHDSSEPDDFMSTDDLRDAARRAVISTRHLTSDERMLALERIAVAADRATDSATIPLIPVHHDCTLRNVVVRRDGFPCLLDLDSMRAAWKSRWFDVVVFLTNLESQSKYVPVASTNSVEQAWRSFWSGYMGAGQPDGLTREQAADLLFLIKVDLTFGGPWRPLFDVYTGLLASRYLKRLRISILNGQYLSFHARVGGAA